MTKLIVIELLWRAWQGVATLVVAFVGDAFHVYLHSQLH
jgi:hypothetical protein